MYCFNTRLRFSELNENLELPLGSLVNLFQDCSTFHSEHLGRGLEYLKQKNQSWLVTAWQIELFDSPEKYENVKVSTWPHKFDKVLAHRNFTLESAEKDKLYAVGNALWSLVDTNTHKPLFIKPEYIDAYEPEPSYPIEYLPRKIKITDEDFTIAGCVPIVHAHIDSNHHVNNGQYLSIADEFLPDNFNYNRIRAEYRKSAILGDEIIIKYNIKNNICIMKLCDKHDNIYTVVEFSTRDNL